MGLPGHSLVRDDDYLYLDGVQVRPGDELDVLAASGAWITIIVVRGQGHALTVLWLLLGGPIELLIPLPCLARFRWTPHTFLRVDGRVPAN